MKKKIYCLLTFGLLFSACNKVLLNNNETSASAPQKALSAYTLENFRKTYNSMEEACASLEGLPAQERIRFTDTKAEFVHEFIWAFEMVIDNTKGTYQVENLRPLYVLLSEDGTKENLLSLPEPLATIFRNNGVMLSEKEPLYTRAFRSLNINPSAEDFVKPIMYHSAIIGAAIAEKEPGNYKETSYLAACGGGKMKGKTIKSNNWKKVSKFMKDCADGGGCAGLCRSRMYVVPDIVLDRYKIPDAELAQLIEITESSNNSSYEDTRKEVWTRDAWYSQSSLEKAVRVE